ncbi:uncharacterized protein STEHIDRAFT_163314 [Stereum hirsutum FP-91666 SS1]|uniref:Uncharacterized protein n=1 Tax=Stereum hirsutum (strain FP-91666) TaxID=721885 RepID=R7RWK8_STEHR|nr:uncharacterized protein STEHIDRAFT_163314 [Stereum hirsutum FP-91666 SS1]EIM79756.1 hypothetical protein STEHIDRAFT_163314 [Stereum hirsutum FP-91666 SS1]
MAMLFIPSAIMISVLVSSYLYGSVAQSLYKELHEEITCVMQRRAGRLARSYAHPMRPALTEPIPKALKPTPNKAKPYRPKEFACKINAASGAGSTSHISGGSKCPFCLHYISEFRPTKCFKFYPNDTGSPGRLRIAVEDRYDDRSYPNMSDNDRFSSSTENSFLLGHVKQCGNSHHYTKYYRPEAELQPHIPQAVQPVRPHTPSHRLSSPPRHFVMRSTELSIKDWEVKMRGLEAKTRDSEAKARDLEAKARGWEAKARGWEAQARDWEAQTQGWEAKTQDWEAKTRDLEAKTQVLEAKTQSLEARIRHRALQLAICRIDASMDLDEDLLRDAGVLDELHRHDEL